MHWQNPISLLKRPEEHWRKFWVYLKVFHLQCVLKMFKGRKYCDCLVVYLCTVSLFCFDITFFSTNTKKNIFVFNHMLLHTPANIPEFNLHYLDKLSILKNKFMLHHSNTSLNNFIWFRKIKEHAIAILNHKSCFSNANQAVLFAILYWMIYGA